jgi:6,7-dimethyl-8-ribityllumazine synthase
MLKKVANSSRRPRGGRFVIVASRYNSKYVDSMVKAAEGELKKAGARSIELIRVPGAFEIPLAVARIARQGSKNPLVYPDAAQRANKSDSESIRDVDAIICLGVLLRGETVHAAHIGEAVTRALMQIQVKYEVPIIHEVLLLENEGQAKARCLDRNHNRGTEAAQTALDLSILVRRVFG